jgi:hypothetical protein
MVTGGDKRPYPAKAGGTLWPLRGLRPSRRQTAQAGRRGPAAPHPSALLRF